MNIKLKFLFLYEMRWDVKISIIIVYPSYYYLCQNCSNIVKNTFHQECPQYNKIFPIIKDFFILDFIAESMRVNVNSELNIINNILVRQEIYYLLHVFL